MTRLLRGSRSRQHARELSSRLAFESLENRIVLATFFVTNGNDAGAGSLRQAITDANALAGADVIEFTGVTSVTLTSGQLAVTDSVAINGASAGPTKVTVQRNAGASPFRVFSVNNGADSLINVSMNNLRIRNGDARDGAAGAAQVFRRGGGIDNTENLTVTNSIITENFAERGGGVSHRAPDFITSPNTRGGTLSIDNTEITNNTAHVDGDLGRGGAISAIMAGKVTITNSKLNNNSASNVGAAGEFSVSMELEMSDTELKGNTNLQSVAGTGSRAVITVSHFQNDITPVTSAVLERVTIEDNINSSDNAQNLGFGAINLTQDANLVLRDSVIRNNTNHFGISTVPIRRDMQLTIERTTISGNSRGGVRFGLYAAPTGGVAMNMIDSTVSGNGGGDYFGQGLVIIDPLSSTITNSTISGNQAAEDGGGMYLSITATATQTNPTLNVTSTTITNNTAMSATGAGRGGGIHTTSGVGAAAFVNLQLRNSIVSGNHDNNPVTAAPDIYDYGSYYFGTSFVSANFSLIGDNSYTSFAEGNPDPNGNIIGGPTGGVINAMLSPLAANGGPTQTHMPQGGSPAINRGDTSITGCDQRGFTRPGGPRVDMGSVESDGSPCSILNLDFNQDGLYNCGDMNLLEQAIDAGTFNASFDVNGDGALTSADVSQWLLDAGELRFGSGRFFRQGDANLDGGVDGSDFGIWNASKFTATNRWCQGDFNQDNSVDGSDFGIWNANKFTASDAGRNGTGPGSPDAVDQMFDELSTEMMRQRRVHDMATPRSTPVATVPLRPIAEVVTACPAVRMDQPLTRDTAQPRAAELATAAKKVNFAESSSQLRTSPKEADKEARMLLDSL